LNLATAKHCAEAKLMFLSSWRKPLPETRCSGYTDSTP